MNSPLDYLCQRCHDIIKWKIDYRKYKPLTTPGRCNTCNERTIIKAYRTICDRCAHQPKVLPDGKTVSQRLCTKCGKDCNAKEVDEETGEEIPIGYADYTPPRKVIQEEQGKIEAEMDEILRKLRERAKRTILRKIDAGEITYSRSKKLFVYVDNEEEFKLDNREDSDDDSDDDHDSDQDDDSDDEVPKKQAKSAGKGKKTSDMAPVDSDDDQDKPKKKPKQDDEWEDDDSQQEDD